MTRHRRTDPHRVVGDADLAAEGLTQVRNAQQMAVFRRGRVGAGAFEQDHVGRPGRACGLNSLGNLRQRGHAGGDDQRLAFGRCLADQRQIGVLKARDLVAGDIERGEKIHRAGVKRGGERDQAKLTGALEDRRMPFPGRVRLIVKIVQPAPGPQAVGLANRKIWVVDIQGHGVGRVGLQLERMSTGGRYGVNDRQRAVERLVVIAAHLRNHKGG